MRSLDERRSREALYSEAARIDALPAKERTKEIREWEAQGKPIPAGEIIKQHIVTGYAKTYKLPVFIETGTYLGLMVNAVKDLFQEIYSIEIDKQLVRYNRRKFSDVGHVTIIHGDSGTELPKIVRSVGLKQQPALYWLDAHFSSGITGKGKEDSPLRKELNFLTKKLVPGSVLLLDDARVFNGQQGYPTIREIKGLVSKNLPGYSCKLEDDVVRIFPKK